MDVCISPLYPQNAYTYHHNSHSNVLIKPFILLYADEQALQFEDYRTIILNRQTSRPLGLSHMSDHWFPYIQYAKWGKIQGKCIVKYACSLSLPVRVCVVSMSGGSGKAFTELARLAFQSLRCHNTHFESWWLKCFIPQSDVCSPKISPDSHISQISRINF